MTTTLTASTTAKLNQDIATVDAATSGGFIIDLQGNITETANLDAINLQSGVQLTINGSGSYTLDGAGSYGFIVDAGSATIENLDIGDAVLAGGPLPDTVTLSNDVFSGTVAISKNLTIDEVAQVTLGDTQGPATVINQAGSTYDVDVVGVGNAINEGPAGVSRFVNKGTLAQTSLATGVSEIHVDVTDTGTLSVEDNSNLRFFGANNSFSGTYVGGGMIDYWDGSTDALGTIDMTSGACTTVEGATVNQGGVVTLSTSTSITILTGTWNFTSNNGLALADPSQPSASGASFTLYSTLAKTGGTGTTVIGCDFNPSGGSAGFITVAHGTLAFNGLISNFYETISGAGTFSIGGGGTDAIGTGTTIDTNGWTITHAGTDVTLNVALSYSGTFREQSGTTLTLTSSNNLTLNNSASFTDATIDGSGILTLDGGKATMNGGTIGAGVTVELLSGTLSESGIVTNSGTLFASGGTVLIAGTANGTTVGVSGKEIVQSGGTASNTTVSSGGTETVLSGGTAIGATIVTGGTVTVSSGGIFEFTSGTTGMPIVLPGATLEIGSGYVFSGTVDSGVKVEVLSGGADVGVTVNSGGRETVLAGGTTSNTTVLRGGTEIVSSGGTDDGAQISGGRQFVYGLASGATIFSGSQIVEAGGIASDTTVSGGGTEIVLSGGTAVGATSLAGGTVTVSSGGTFEFTSGTTATPVVRAGATLEIGSGYVFSGTVNSGVKLEILSGGADVGATVSSGGREIVLAGGTASNTTVLKGGAEIVSSGGTASGTAVLSGGTLDVLSGGLADAATIFSGGSEIVSAHGTDDGAQISGGKQLDYGSASSATVFSGSQIVEAGGIASDTTVSGGGTEIVLSGGSSIDLTIGSGGTSIVSSGGSAAVSGATSGLIEASGKGAQVQLDNATVSGGTLSAGTGAMINTFGSFLSGVTIASGSLVSLEGGGAGSNTLQLDGTIVNSGTILVSGGPGFNFLDAAGSTVTLTGGGTVSLASSLQGDGIAALTNGDTLINLNNTISGAGFIGVANNDLTFTNSGIVNANVNTTNQTLVIDRSNAVSNAGTLEATNSGGLYLLSTTVDNTTSGLVVASGAKAEVILENSTISGGILRASGTSAAIVTVNGTTDAIIGAAIALKSLVEATSGSTLTLSGGTIGSGALVETLNGGTATVSGTVNNSGTLFASGSGSLLEIANGAVVNGGVAEVGNGIVDIQGASSENVTFQAGGSGGLDLADDAADPTAYTGKVFGFGVSGGISHADHTQYIDLTSVSFAAGQISASYTSANASNTSGTLIVSSGSAVVADITLVGAYVTSNFHISSGAGGTVEITDPSVAEQPSGNAPATIAGGTVLAINTPDSGKVIFGESGGTLQLAQPATFAGTVAAFATPDGIDLPGIGFGATTTLAFSENNSRTGGTLTVTDGTHAAAIALLGNYMASTLVTGADGHGGTLVTEAPQPGQPPLLTRPHA